MTSSTLEWRRLADRYLGGFRHAQRNVGEEKLALARAEKHAEVAEEAQKLVQAVAAEIQQAAHAHIASVVTQALQAVFGDGIKFCIVFAKLRGKTEARLTFVKNGEEEDPLGASSGGMVDIAALALRIICIMLTRPARRRVVLLDEPLKSVHGEGNRERARQLVEDLASRMGFQIVISTGLNWLKCGHVIEIEGA